MKLHIVARGRTGRSAEGELVERYLKRIAWPTIITELPESGPSKLPDLLKPAVTIVLDERGAALGSVDFARRLERWQDTGIREARFLIGGADGHDDAIRASADLLLGFGPATWPHLMVRAMLAEQLYRATTILTRHPYHREG